MGISGNECADSAAKAVLQKVVSERLISYTDVFQYISQCERGTAVITSFMLQNP